MKNSETSNLSYEEYMKDQLEILSKHFNIKVYKRADKEQWFAFESGLDLRIQIQWSGKYLYEFLVEKSFWYQRNSNKEDRSYMRRWADLKIEMIKCGLIRKPSKPSKPNITKSKKINSICSTQDAFEKMKQT